MNNFDFNNFKIFFWPYEIYNTQEENNFNEKLSNQILVDYQKKIIAEINNSKEEILEKIENKRGCKILRSDFFLNFEQFYNLLKNTLIIYQNNFFEIALKNIFYENITTKTNKINLLDFLTKICENYSDIKKKLEPHINNSEVKSDINKIRKKFLNRINSLKDDIKINFKDKILGKEETLNNFNIKNQCKIVDSKVIDGNSNRNIINNFEMDKFTNINSFRASFNNKKHKNIDIINLI